jgi:hypothetical protein
VLRCASRADGDVRLSLCSRDMAGIHGILPHLAQACRCVGEWGAAAGGAARRKGCWSSFRILRPKGPPRIAPCSGQNSVAASLPILNPGPVRAFSSAAARSSPMTPAGPPLPCMPSSTPSLRWPRAEMLLSSSPSSFHRKCPANLGAHSRRNGHARELMGLAACAVEL